ncbi:hypothetical protein HUS23_10115 [Ectothiorhodospiraceae bacterium 2226]|nr:hypothetical protein HUS23_10115 [Ectothiorhodospiraceae bacterium 2226]
MSALEQKLVAWFADPRVQALRLDPVLFWARGDKTPFGRIKVDPRELEVFLAAVLGEPSECREDLERTEPGRASFLAANARRHELPLLRRRSD